MQDSLSSIASWSRRSETRERLPNSVVTKLIPWAERNNDLLMPFARRVTELAPAARDGVFVLATTKLVKLGEAGQLAAVGSPKAFISYEKRTTSTEVAVCLSKSCFVGRWLASAGTPATVLGALGVQL
jgi:hypothetical protein